MKDANRIKLKYVADHIQRGDAPTYVDSNGVTVINQACVQPSGVDLSKSKLHDPEDTGRITAWLKRHDVLINSTGTGTLGRVAHVRDEPIPKMWKPRRSTRNGNLHCFSQVCWKPCSLSVWSKTKTSSPGS